MSAAAPVGSDQTVTATYSGDANYVGGAAVNSLTVFADPGVYVPLTPTRICDTRANNPSHLCGSAAQCVQRDDGRGPCRPGGP